MKSKYHWDEDDLVIETNEEEEEPLENKGEISSD